MKTEDGLAITNIERTLIDATVRPLYSGGVYEVFEAYRRAAEHISVNKLAAMALPPLKINRSIKISSETIAIKANLLIVLSKFMSSWLIVS